MLRISSKLRSSLIEESHYLLSMIFNSIRRSKVTYFGSRLNSCSMITKNSTTTNSSKVTRNCSGIKFSNNTERRREEGRGGNSKGIGTVQQLHTAFQRFSCTLLPVVSRENCTAGYAVSRNTVAKISRVFYRAFLPTYLFHGWSDDSNSEQVITLVDDTFARRSSKRPYEGHAWIIRCVSLV